MSEDVYTRLREFLDTLPAGFPATDTGVEIKILKRLFTPEQAELTMKLKEEPEEVHSIAARIGEDESELAEKLEDMAQKGIIYRVRDGHERLYQAYQFVIGIYEFQLKNIDKKFAELFEEFLPYYGMSLANVKTSQMRVIPLDSAIEAVTSVATYNKVRDLVREQEIIAVQQCICRKEQELLGNKCNKPQEVCIGFGDFAQFYIDNKMGRQVSVDEALKVLDLAEESGLILTPTNSQKLEAICCCCSCCCPNYRFSKMTERPADMVRSYYEAKIDPDLCTACGECIERCQMDAIKEGDEVSELIDGRCIGCGLCVPTCPSEAISLVAKPNMDAPPMDFQETINRIRNERSISA
jgi:ferredoxin/predicted transcriptional regulator